MVQRFGSRSLSLNKTWNLENISKFAADICNYKYIKTTRSTMFCLVVNLLAACFPGFNFAYTSKKVFKPAGIFLSDIDELY
jgi:hypothetical protein